MVENDRRGLTDCNETARSNLPMELKTAVRISFHISPDDMSRRDDHLSLHAIRRIDERCDAFESLRRVGQSPHLADYLAGCEGGERAALLRELVAIELHYAQVHGQARDKEYFKRVLPQDVEFVNDIILDHESRGNADTDDEALATASTSTGTEDMPTPSRLGRYRILQRLGAGAFGVVYLAHDPDLNRQVAIKCPRFESGLYQSRWKSFRREAELAAKLRHPGIVAIYDVARDDRQQPYIVMEYVEGCSLRTWLESNQPTPVQTARIVKNVAETLHVAHRAGLIHRDLKPANILVDRHGNPHLADLGLAVTVDENSHGEIAGTYAYMAPEQLRGGNGSIDLRCDIWSLGVVLYEMLCRRRPFEAADRVELCEQVLNQDPLTIDSRDRLVRHLARIAQTCLSKCPDDRYTSAADMVDALRGVAKPTPRTWLVPRIAGVTVLFIACLFVLRAMFGVSLLKLVGIGPQTNATLVNKEFATDGEFTLIDGVSSTLPNVKDFHQNPQPSDRRQQFRAVSGLKQPGEVTRAHETSNGSFSVVGNPNRFGTLADAVANAADGGVVDVSGNGPFLSGLVDIGHKELTIRAAQGHRPVFVLADQALPTLINTNGNLTLIGLELRRSVDPQAEGSHRGLVTCEGGSIGMRACRFVLEAPRKNQCILVSDSQQVSAERCEFYHIGSTGILFLACNADVEFSHCVFAGETNIVFELQGISSVLARLKRNTFVARNQIVLLKPGPDHSVNNSKLLVESDSNAFQGGCLLKIFKQQRWVNQILKNRVLWHDSRSMYAVGRYVSNFNRRISVDSLSEWEKLSDVTISDILLVNEVFPERNILRKASSEIDSTDFVIPWASLSEEIPVEQRDLGA